MSSKSTNLQRSAEGSPDGKAAVLEERPTGVATAVPRRAEKNGFVRTASSVPRFASDVMNYGDHRTNAADSMLFSAVAMNPDVTRTLIDENWSSSIVPTLQQYIGIPNQSPLYDPDWRRNGYMHQAVALAKGWVEQQGIKGLTIEVHEVEERTPIIFMEIDGDPSSTVLMYGHLDKQPAMVGWEDGLGPWTPVLRDGKLYGRGGADDGYAIFATVSSIASLQRQNLPHSRIVVLIECCEESGSIDLPTYIELLADRIGTPRLVICLDSGCGTYDQLWMTTSLRGSIVA